MTIHQRFSIEYSYDILFTDNMFTSKLFQKTVRQSEPTSVAVIIDDGFIKHWPKLIATIEYEIESISTLACPILITPGGESSKNNINQCFGIIKYINEAKLDRQSLLIGVGGGAVLDLVGFAAAITHRGIKHLRVPTTVLSQNDSGVGTKNGINLYGKKNFLGTFVPPFSVINDYQFLTTLSDRDWRSGIAEAIKVAVLKDPAFFNWLCKHVKDLNNRTLSTMEVLIQRCAKLHAEHISKNGDPFETTSSRPLDFGHWSAHKLEQISQFTIKHGEAVAIGILIDCAYSVEIGILKSDIFYQIFNLCQILGFDCYPHQYLSDLTVINHLIKGLDEFREHLGGTLTIPLIQSIGSPIEVNHMSRDHLILAIEHLKKATYEIS